ncbi:MAG: carbohydrate-binding protein, partial [Verrucomicrobia bacterium]
MTAFRSLLNLLPAIIAGAIMLASPVGWAGTVPERLVGSHHMVAFAWSTTDQSQFDEEARRWKEAGFDFVVLHMDAYDSGYPDQLRRYYDAAAKVGIKCIPSWSWFYWATYTDENGNPDPEYPGRVWIPQIVRDTRDHPAQFKIDGVPVYSGYNFPWYSKEMLEAAGEWPVIFWPHMYYYDPAVGNTLHATNDPDRIRAMYDTFPWLSGLCNFSGDMSLQTIIDLNHVLNEVGRERGKWTMAGVTAFYGSHNLHDYGGYQGVAAQWAAILQDQPNAVWWVTTNDWNELSYVADLPESPVWTNHWNKHHMADPLDHSGYRKFAEPYLAAYKAGLTTPVITRDRLFICYQLHPKDVEPIAGSPDHMYGGRTWRSQLPDRIFVAAHLTAPARLKINDKLSEEFPAGIAHFDIPLTVGPAPHVAIVRNGTEVKAGDAPLPITDSPEVGAWNYLAVEIAPDADATPITTPPPEPAPDPTPAPDPEPTPAPSPTPPAATPIPDDYESWVWPRSEQFTQLADYYFTWGRESVTGAVTWTPDSFPAASVKYITNDGQDATITLSDTFPVGTSLLLNAKFWSFGKRIIFAAQNGTTIKYITAEGSEAAANTNAAGEIWIHLERRSDGWAFEWAGAGWKEFADPVFAISGGRHTTENGYTRPARYSSYVRGGYSVRFHSNARRIYLYLHLNATQFRVIANGVVTHEAVDDPARPQGTWGVFPIDFGSSAERDIEILFDNDTPFIGVMAPPSLGTITPWAGEPWRATMAVIGDSICEGGTRGYAWSAAHLLNLDAIVSPMGSTGYVDPGFISGYPHDFQTRLEADILQHEPDIVLISGGINDQSHPADDQNDPAAFEAAVRSVFTRVDERLPNAIKVALSPFWPNENFAPVNVEYTRIVQRVAAERGWHFIDFRTIPNDLTDRLISGDGVHPTREGWAYLGAQLAEDLAPIIGGTVQPAPAPDTPASEPDPDPAPEPPPAPTPPAAGGRAPYLETPAAIPGRIEAEHFDLGGEGIAYADTTAQNEGGALRSEGVDLETHPAGINIGWFRPGEWIGYTVNIVQAGDYALTLRVACLGAGGRLKLTLDGADLTDPIQIPDTGAWDAWTSLTTTVSLPEGQHDLRIVGIDTANAFNAVANVDWIAFEALPPPVTTPPPDPEPAPEPTPAPSPEPSPAPEPEPSPTPEPEPPVVILPDPPSSTPDPEPQPEPPSVEP